MKYRLIQDDNSHWYIIPVCETENFYEWNRKMGEDLPCNWPEWLVHIDGPHRITFDEYKQK